MRTLSLPLSRPTFVAALSLSLVTLALSPAEAQKTPDDVTMFGGTPSRNMVSDETGLPSTWDLDSGENVKWRQSLGSQSYGGPVVAGGRVLVGTNNEGKKNPKLENDRGNLMVFMADTGEFLWQSAHAKLGAGRVNDWPLQGVVSTPYVDGDSVWYVSNRAEVLKVDLQGFRDEDNDGPVKNETETSWIDEDVIWRYDMIGELDVFPHNLAAGNPLVIGDILFTVTGNGVDEGHINIPSPTAPSFIALDKNTGKLLWENDLPGELILHGQWSNPAYGKAGGREQIVFPGGDGWMYSLDPKGGDEIWRFDLNPKESRWELGGSGTKNNIVGTPVFLDGVVYIAVGQDPEHGEGPGALWAIDASKTGDVTGTAGLWRRGGEDYGRTISTVAIADGILYAADLSGRLYALDQKTGEHFWTYDAFAAIWGSPFVADGKVYLGDEDGDVAILKHGKEMKLLGELNMGSAVYTTPVARDGVLYIMSRNTLFALEQGAKEKAPPKTKTGPMKMEKAPAPEAEPATPPETPDSMKPDTHETSVERGDAG